MKTIAVIDYGVSNHNSASKALEQVAEPDTRIIVSSSPEDVLAADRVVLSGIADIRHCVEEIERQGMDEIIREIIATRPLLGICVGMQVLLDHSEENDGVDCLGLFPGDVKFFGDDLLDHGGNHLPVPHKQWNQVSQAELSHPLWHGIEDNARFYFEHRYHPHLANEGMIAGRCEYGVSFDAALCHENVFAVQFLPEESKENGLKLLGNFLKWRP